MPKGYIIFTEKVTDQEGMGAYLQAAFPTLMAAGGNPIVFGPPESVVEGDWHGDQTVILEFARSTRHAGGTTPPNIKR